MWRTIFLLLLVSYSYPAFPQNRQKKLQRNYLEVKSALKLKDYDKAKKILSKIIETNEKCVEAKLYLADIYHLEENLIDEIYWLEKAVKEDTTFFPKAVQLLGDAYFATKQYKSAELCYIDYLKIKLSQPTYVDSLKLESAQLAQVLSRNSDTLLVSLITDSINTCEEEYSPSLPLNSNQILFTRQSTVDGFTQEDIFTSFSQEEQVFGVAHPIDGSLNTSENEGAQCISSDGKYMFFTACNRNDGFGSCDLYISQRLSDGTWSISYNLGKDVNSKYWDSHPSISTDGSRLYFASSRGGKKRKGDIYVSERVGFALNGFPIFGHTRALGNSVNTPLNETTPFIHADQKTLYFASEGHPGLGKLDLFTTCLQSDNSWSSPINLGLPINDEHSNSGFILSGDGEIGMISKPNRLNGDRDIVAFSYVAESRPLDVVVISGRVVDAETKAPLNSMLSFVTLKSNDTLAYASSSLLDGVFITSIPDKADTRLLVEANGYLFYSERIYLEEVQNFPLHLEIELNRIERDQVSVMKNLFFDTNKWQIKAESYSELDALAHFLDSNKQISIEIGGHTDNTGSQESNQILSEKRAEEVVVYLEGKGILRDRLTCKGYAATLPIRKNTTEEGRAENRRIEVKIVDVK